MPSPGRKIGTDDSNAFRFGLKQHWGIRFAIAIAGTAITWWLQYHLFQDSYVPVGSTRNEVHWEYSAAFLVTALSLVFALWTIYLTLEGLSRLGKAGTTVAGSFALLLAVYFTHMLLSDWFGPSHNGLVRSLYWIAPLAAILLYPLPIMRMKRKAIEAAMLGDYERALRTSKTWLRSNPYGRPFRGWILLTAGRYSEAEADLKEAAFDGKGMPRLTNLNLYYYAAALMNQGKNEEAQELLEPAIRVPQKLTLFHFLLADCLLSQNKEPNRARELVAHVIADLRTDRQRNAMRGLIAQCVAIDAWALAVIGRREEAERKLEDAFAESASFSNHELAGLMHLKGVVWGALGNPEKAREAFRKALELFPYGSIAVLARKRLTELGEEAVQ